MRICALAAYTALALVISGYRNVPKQDQGALLGAVVGGVLGNQFGGGRVPAREIRNRSASRPMGDQKVISSFRLMMRRT